MMKSWRTTVAGILGGVMLIAPELLDLLNGSFADVAVDKVVAGIGIMMAGVLARDNVVTSEDAGARR